jgi:hypothetical protein
VFEDRVFDRLFADMVAVNPEGELLKQTPLYGSVRQFLRGRRGPYAGYRFDEETVAEYAGSSSTLPAARGCLALAWRHRRALGLDPR